MEEILASIRRIISDDQTAKAAPVQAPAPIAARPLAPAPVEPMVAVSPARPAPVSVDDDDDVMDLTPRVSARVQEPHFITDDPVENDLSFEDIKPVAPPAPVSAPKGQDDIDALMAAAEFHPQSLPSPVTPSPVERLVSPATDRMVNTAFSSLANTILTNNARTIEDLMTDMMRPMIKDWLDDNLPGIVERLVKAEIERVARGGR
jgi:uncharacterized protein